jgi:HK97 family phage major capsid protein
MTPTVKLHPNPRGASLARLAKCLAATKKVSDAIMFAHNYLRDTPEVEAFFDLQMKGTVAAGNIGDVANGGALAQAGMWSEIAVLLRDFSAFDAATPQMRRVPTLVQIPRDSTSGVVGGVVAEGAPTPVVALTSDNIILEPQKICALLVLTRELLKLNPATDAFVADTLLQTIAAPVNLAFLEPAASTAITHGVAEVPSTGATAAAIVADLLSNIAAISTELVRPVWFMKRRTMSHIALTLGAAASDLPRSLAGIPVIASSSVPTISGSPTQHVLALVDLAHVYFSDNGYELARSTEAAVEMSSTPTQSGLTPTASAVTSLFQSGLAGFLQTRWANWSAKAGAVSWTGVAY